MQKTSVRSNNPRIFLEDLNNIRELIRIVVLFGCFTGNDLVEEELFSVIHTNEKLEDFHFSKRKLDTDKKRIKAIYPPDFLGIRKKDRKDIMNITPDLYDRQDDTLLRLFRYRSFRDNEIFMYFYLMQWFAMENDSDLADEDGSTIRNIASSLYDNSTWKDLPDNYLLKDKLRTAGDENDDIINAVSNRIRPHIEKLVDAGYIQQNTVTEPMDMDDHIQNVEVYKYRLAENPLDAVISDYPPSVSSGLYSLLRFLAKTEPLAVPYYFASNKIKLAVMANGEEYPEPVILYRHNHMYNVLDNEVMFDLLRAIKNNSVVKIVYKDRINDTYQEDISYTKGEMTAVPLECRHDYITGRQYAIALDLKTGGLVSFRMDQILTAEETGERSDLTDQDREALAKKAESWTASLKNAGEKHLVQIEFKYRNPKLRLRLNREKGEGTIIKRSDDTDLYQIEVNDPMDMVPWIRSFGSSAKMLRSNDPKTEEARQRIIASWKEALKLNGAL